ncbi:MAG: VCBS repeat-containing protein, partial [Candidatus Omnitrophica bacterium]|nr:VCBS repeat-containing protein [Candidatus Omnitrophota bacterium]
MRLTPGHQVAVTAAWGMLVGILLFGGRTPVEPQDTAVAPGTSSTLPYRLSVIDAGEDGRPVHLVGFDTGWAGMERGGIANALRVIDFRGSPPSVVVPAILIGGERSHPHMIAVRDVNGDGHADVAVTTSRPAVSVLLRDPRGGFKPAQRYETTDTSRGVALVDVNRDGHPDLVYTTEYEVTGWDRLVYRAARVILRPWAAQMPFRYLHPPGALKIRLGDGTGAFGAERVYDASPKAYTVVAGDLDADGDPDLVVTHESTNRISVFFNDGQGRFGDRRVLTTTGDRANHAAVADFNADGHPDIVVANWGWYDASGTPSVTLFFGEGGGRFQEGEALPAIPGSCWVKTADLDRDGDQDFVVTSWLSTYAGVYLNQGGGRFERRLVETGPGNYGFSIRDLNGDGLPDLITGNWRDGSFSKLYGNGDGTFRL